MRFPEFSGEWSKDCLNEFLVVQPARNTQGIYSKDDVLSVSGDYGVVNQIQLLGRSFAGKDVSNYHIVRTNEIVYTKSPLKEFPYGIVKTNQGTAGIVSTLYAVYSAKSNTNPKFVEYYFSSKERTNKYFKPIVRIGAKHDMKIGNEEVLRNIVVFPSKQEQNKIQEFLRIIDERIAIQSKIIEELTTLRSALIEKCAKQSGNFFSLSDILREVEERSTTANQYQVLSSTVKGIFSQKEYFNKDIASEDNKGYKVVRKGHVVLSPQNLWMGNINYNDQFDIGIVSPSYKVFLIKEGFNPIFIAALLQTKKALNEYMLASEQGASIVRRNLNIEAFMAIKFRIPDARQQDSLSMAITAINAKLNNERCYLEQLTMQKSCLLENMFI